MLLGGYVYTLEEKCQSLILQNSKLFLLSFQGDPQAKSYGFVWQDQFSALPAKVILVVT